MCELCGYNSDYAEMRACRTCYRGACLWCMPVESVCCIRCPGGDDVRESGGLDTRCQKCCWSYRDGDVLHGAGASSAQAASDLRQCRDCRLAICEWCSCSESPRCLSSCPSMGTCSASSSTAAHGSLEAHARGPIAAARLPAGLCSIERIMARLPPSLEDSPVCRLGGVR